MYDENVIIQENRRINEKYYKLSFKSAALSRNVKPGQFLHAQIHPAKDPFLRRPFSYYRVKGPVVEVLYEVLGRGTKMLTQKQKGDSLKIMGPLGRAFTGKLPAKKKRVLIAGGVGVPPLVFLAEKFPTDYLLIGTKSKSEVMPRAELAKVKARVLYATNDGSFGKKGFVTLLFEDLLKKENPADLFAQTCGPNIMMQAVIDMARGKKVEGEASLDKPMACGVGACLGCMVKTVDGWTASCTQGPVFNFNQLDPLMKIDAY